MNARSLAYLSRCSVSELVKSAQHVLSRALTTLDPNPSFVDDSFINLNGKSSIDTGYNMESVDLNLLFQLQQYGFSRTPYVINKLISLCAKVGDLGAGIQLHCAVVKMGFFSNVYISSALVGVYVKCANVTSAKQLFDEMPHRNVVTWNSLISGYLKIFCPEIALGLFLEMLRVGIMPTAYGVSAILLGCAQLEAGELGTQIHGLSFKNGFCSNVVAGTSLVNMYAKCTKVKESRRVFDGMPERNVVTWTTMLTGYAQNKLPVEAMILFREMWQIGLELNRVTYNSLLSSFSGRDHLDHCKQIHSRIIREGLESNLFIQATLLSVYSECDCSLEDFHKIFLGITQWDQISWNAVVAGFSRLECDEEALQCFSNMRRKGFSIDFFTFSSILRAIGKVSALEIGKQTHALVFKTGYASNVFVQNGLVSMYTRCGLINDVKKVFFAMDEHDLISWNSLLLGCAYHGYGQEVGKLFEQMKNMGIQPDENTIFSVLSACSHVGLLEKGLEYVELFGELYFNDPHSVEHYASIVDLLGRAGYVQEAEAFINSMPMKSGPSMYKSLISSCKVYGNMEIAVRASQRLLELYPDDPATYVLLSSSFAVRGCWDEAAGVRRLMQHRGVQKEPGYSWVE